MADFLSPQQRSALMSSIRGKDTKPEMAVRQMAWRLGYRYRLHRRDLPGTPDMTFPKLRKVIFVHGCFWHRHEGCRYTVTPKTSTAFWEAKFQRNIERDDAAVKALEAEGWCVLVIWECEVAKSHEVEKRLKAFLR